MKKQRILSALLALCLVFSLVPTALAAGADGFTDVGKDSWCYEYVDYVTSEGYFLGTTDTTFSPNRNMTRAMFVVVLSRFDGVKVDNSRSSFTDVEPGAWCAGAVEWAVDNGIVTGYADGTFKPNASITRAQMCAIMDRYVDYYTDKYDVTVAQKGKAATLADQSQVPSYATKAVKNCQVYGLIYGYEDGTFRPQAYSTRAHVAAIIYRLAMLIKNAKPVSSGRFNGNGGRLPETSTTTDYIGSAVEASIKQANETYKTIKTAIKNAVADSGYLTSEQISEVKSVIDQVLSIDTVVYSNKSDGDSRPQTLTAAVRVTDDLTAEIIKEATDLALQLVDDKPTKADVEGLIQEVKAAVLEKTGIDLSASIEDIEAAVIQKLKDEGKSLWTNFYDGNGNYYCGDVTITAGDYTVTVKVDADKKSTDLVGTDKTTAVKKIAEAVSKEMFQQLKDASKGEYIGKATLNGTVTLTFADSAYAAYAEDTARYPHEYPVTLKLTVDGEDMVKYKYANDESYLKFCVTDVLKDAYDEVLSKVSINAVNPETKETLVKEIQTKLDSVITDELVSDLNDKIAQFGVEGIKIDRDEILGALQNEVSGWVDVNMTRFASYVSSNDGAVLDGLNNDAFVDVILERVEPHLTESVIDDVIEAQVGKIEGQDMVNMANDAIFKKYPSLKDLVDGGTAEFKPAIPITDVEGLNDLLKCNKITVTVSVDGFGTANTAFPDEGGFGAAVKQLVIDEANDMLQDKIDTDPELFGDLSDTTKEYLIYSSLVKAGLTAFDGKVTASMETEAKEQLLSVVKNAAEVKINDTINEKIKSAIEDVDIAAAFGSEEEYQETLKLAEQLANISSDNIANVKFKSLANVLRNETLQDRIGSAGNTLVSQYLARIISRIPDGASVTINDVKLNVATLDKLADATTTVEAMEALANILDDFSELTLKDFAESKGGIPVEIDYNNRTFDFVLVVE